MFLVKSCESEFNVCNSNTIKIGTLHEYRQTEREQILDKEEGFYTLHIDIINCLMNIDLFHMLQACPNSDVSFYIKSLTHKGWYKNSVYLSFSGEYKWKNHNRFIFCISQVAKHEDSINIFPDYNDYWYIHAFNLKKFKEILKRRLFHEIKQLLHKGQKIFNKEDINIKNLSIRCYSQEIIYSDRNLYLNNSNINMHTKDVVDLFENIKFIKSKDYSHEKELRIVFDFYDGEELLIPVVKDVIIFGSLSKIVKQKA